MEMDLILNEANHALEIDNLLYQAQLPVEANKGTPYPCSQSDIDEFQHCARGNQEGVADKTVAVQMLEDFLDPLRQPSHAVLEALMRLRAARWNPNWGLDIIIKAAKDLDIAFFDGRLRGSVAIRWSLTWSVPANLRACVFKRYGMMWPGLGPELGMCLVHLYADEILCTANPCEQMWQTMLHEMIHAYGIVTAHTSYLGTKDDLDPGHGRYFERLHCFVDHRAHKYMSMCVMGAREVCRFPWRNISGGDDQRQRMLESSYGPSEDFRSYPISSNTNSAQGRDCSL
ncbi:hypothetical protein N7G274_001208 [Stereocaulon virgatum]|uniref:SprT-like domain-containing protein n=1 Tax=Stereocaulon virgatum TaxID=373712 RepID=A0ABR4AN69_9LECA